MSGAGGSPFATDHLMIRRRQPRDSREHMRAPAMERCAFSLRTKARRLRPVLWPRDLLAGSSRGCHAVFMYGKDPGSRGPFVSRRRAPRPTRHSTPTGSSSCHARAAGTARSRRTARARDFRREPRPCELLRRVERGAGRTAPGDRDSAREDGWRGAVPKHNDSELGSKLHLYPRWVAQGTRPGRPLLGLGNRQQRSANGLAASYPLKSRTDRRESGADRGIPCHTLQNAFGASSWRCSGPRRGT